MEELMAYGKQKNVGIILWVVWKTLADQQQPALDQFAKWGAKGIKVDFMQRDDQLLINFYHDLARETAKRKMLLDFHGAVRPATMTRTWPNLISTEGVKGMEWSKWSAESNPAHNVALPFTRMFLGPMDFTPGAMLNATKAGFAQIFDRPMAMGTRCHQLAMYVVFESPLQMLADSPSNYLREPEAMEFLSAVPTVWDETRVLDAKIAEYVVVARRKGSDWYIGAMTNWTPRDLEIDLGFLPAGNFPHGNLPGRRERQPHGERLQAREELRQGRCPDEASPRRRRRLGRAHSSVVGSGVRALAALVPELAAQASVSPRRSARGAGARTLQTPTARARHSPPGVRLRLAGSRPPQWRRWSPGASP